LTPSFLTDPKFTDGVRRGLSLSLLDDRPVLRGMGPDGSVAERILDVPGFADVLLVVEGDFRPVLDETKVGTIWWDAAGAAETAVAALTAGRWTDAGKDWGLGRAVDAAWIHERHICRPDSKLDMAYAKARSLGAWGGRPSDGRLVLLALPEKHELIRKALT
jgi:hypothetical protein